MIETMAHVLWLSAGVLVFTVWTYLAFLRGGFWRLRNRLQPVAGTDTPPARTVAAVIPARDEAGLIGRAVGSLRRQRFRGTLRIVVADDESADETNAEAEAAGAEVVRVGLRPAEWKGKLWALAKGIDSAEAGADYLLLTDADIDYESPDVLEALVAQAETGFDLVSVMVRLRCESMGGEAVDSCLRFLFLHAVSARNPGGGRGMRADPARDAGADWRDWLYPDGADR